MTVRGWIYIFTNESMPGQVKVGFTTKAPSVRARSMETEGVATPYAVVYAALVTNARKVEGKAHKALKKHHVRKEWFSCSAAEAIAAIRAVAGDQVITDSPADSSRFPEGGATAFATPEQKAAFVEEVERLMARRSQEREPQSPLPTTPEADSFKERALAAQKAWKAKQWP